MSPKEGVGVRRHAFFVSLRRHEPSEYGHILLHAILRLRDAEGDRRMVGEKIPVAVALDEVAVNLTEAPLILQHLLLGHSPK